MTFGFGYAMIAGEVSNFVAYIYAPAILVTQLGALSIIVRWDFEVLCAVLKLWQGTPADVSITNLGKSE